MILVTGSTGNVGRALVKELVDAGAEVRGLTRNAAGVDLPGAQVVEGDLGRAESLGEALAGVKGIFLFQCGNEAAVLRAAKEAGVERVVLLSTVATKTRPESTIGHDHLQAEHAIADSGLSWTSLRPGGFASNTLGWAPMVQGGVVHAPFADVALPTIHPGDIAAVARAALLEDGHDNRVYQLTGPELVTPGQQVAAIGKAIGRELEYVEISREAAREAMIAHMPAEIVDATLDFIGSPTEEELHIVPTVEKVTGKPARSYEQWALENADRFR
ncbi:NAD(P)H-binding protein [Saccharopolyspora taberi]|uniref:NAD(P)H-binding protein n=1 Tax=Saccharopolyspora taberi TaxID=60895 RepID=A0ABN3VBQ8_9PSEU